MDNRKTIKVRTIWENFLKGDLTHSYPINSEIINSWKRCINSGIDPNIKGPMIFLNNNIMKDFLNRNAELVEVAKEIMDNLYKLVKGSGFLVMLCDREAYILRAIGDRDIMSSANKINFIEGANWGEESVGTNAISMCMQTGGPEQVFAEEHFCHIVKQWTCSSAPIFSNGKIIGVLNMSAHYSKVQDHTLGMVAVAANNISSILREKQISKELNITNHILNMMMENIEEGIIATDRNDNILRVNERIYTMFDKRADDIIGKNIDIILPRKKIRGFKDFGGQSLINEINIRVNRRNNQFIIKSRKIIENDLEKGILYTINEAKNVKKLVNTVVGSSSRIGFSDIIGHSKNFLKLVNTAKQISKSNSNILLMGESGTGKEMFAQAIHNESLKKGGPFIAINCGAIPRELIGSELFGYAEGAFTGARKYGNTGKFELADGGTIFLDEIGDMPFDMQVALLRVLENKVVNRIGSNKSIRVDVRVIAATNKNLKDAVRNGEFREDLYYRLNVLSLEMIPLRRRIDDIRLLADFFVNKYNLLLSKGVNGITDDALQALMRHKWPGNVRELENTIERAINISACDTISVEDLRLEKANRSYVNTRSDTLSNIEKETIINKLIKNEYNVTRTAKELGIAKSTLYRKMKLYDIKRSVS